MFERKHTEKASAKIIPRSDHNISRSNINSHALKVLYTLKDAGFKAYLVGGGVRDLLLGLHPKDFDVVTNAHPDQIKPLFRRCLLIGRRFRLAHVYFGHEFVEVATFRCAQNSKNLHERHHSQHGMLLRDNVYGKNVAEDVWRRDFTVNALYYDIADFSIIDYCQGMEDLHLKQLRIIGEPTQRYQEDPVRLLRAVRLAAKLDFEIEKNTEQPIQKLAPLLAHVPPARLFDEIIKLFHSGKAQPALELLQKYQLLEYLFPETTSCCKQNPVAANLLTLTCKTTDERINSGKHVSIPFLLASILWQPFQNNLLEQLQKQPFSMALYSAIHKTIGAQIKIISVPKRFNIVIREIWELQIRLENCFQKQIPRILSHPRFRAAYDFLLLRYDSGEQQLKNTVHWWTNFLESNEKQQQELLRTLPKKPRPRKKK